MSKKQNGDILNSDSYIEGVLDGVAGAISVSSELSFSHDDANDVLNLGLNPSGIDPTALDGSGGSTDQVLLTDGSSISWSSLTTSEVSEGSNLYYTAERARDDVGAALTGSGTVSISTDDGNDTITITGNDTSRTDEEIMDVVGNAITASGDLTYTYDDANDQMELSVTDDNTTRSDEEIEDVIAGRISTSGAMSFNHNDASNLLEFSSTDTQRTDEEIRDVASAQLIGGSDISLTKDDQNDSVTIDFTGTTGGGDVSVSDNGTEILAAASGLNFSTNLSVSDDGDGTVTITGSGSGDTHVTISDDGTQVDASPSEINFGSNLSVTDNGSGVYTVDASGGGTTYSAGTGISLSSDTFSLDESYQVTWTTKQTFSAGLDAGSSAITSVSDPSNAQDAATKNYVDTNLDSSEKGSLSTGMTEWADGLSNAEIERIQLQSGETLHVERVEFQQKGGGSSASASVRVRDETGAFDISNVDLGSVSKDDGQSQSGNLVTVAVSNSTGGLIVGSVKVHYRIEGA